jgi:hypothetical protein
MDHQKQIRYRCPVCFGKENDVVLLKDERGDFYCVKCSFTGTLEQVKGMYGDFKKRYQLLTKRFTLDELKNL